MSPETRMASRIRRHERVREKVRGTSSRPRLAVYRSLKGIYVQLVDDVAKRTLAAASSKGASGNKTAQAKAVGTALAERAKAAGLTEVVFDRGGYRYHGRVKALGDAARAGGLKF